MLKEMHEQPKAVKDTLTPRIKNGDVVIEELGMTDEEIRAIRKIFIVACGSAYHTGVTSKYIFEKLARIPVEVDLASRIPLPDPILPENTLVVIVSQSGETADTLAALREAKAKGVQVPGHRKRSRKFDCERGRQCDVYLGRTGNRCGDNEGVQHTADRPVSSGDEICPGKGTSECRGDSLHGFRSEAAAGTDFAFAQP